VSVLNIYKGRYKSSCWLDGREVHFISAFLFHEGTHDNPATLLANSNKSFLGFKVYGQGFLFDDSDPDATPLNEMRRIINTDERNSKLIFPYIGGAEVNTSPTHSHHRYAINFFDMSEEDARAYPELMHIVEEKVKPERDLLKRDALRQRWWQYGEKQPGLVRAVSPFNQVIVCCQTSKYRTFSFLPSSIVFSHKIVVIASPSFSAFCVLHSRIHEIWALFFGSTMKDDPVYTSSDCFETFPFPENWEIDSSLEAIGKHYYEFRAKLMVRNNEGLTDTYNRFHDPNEFDPDILKLRQLHEEMDSAVLAAYGWSDLQLQCEFRLDYEDEEEEEEESSKRQRKKPYRYRWNEATHDEVLARLLALNQTRYEQEILGGKSAKAKSPKAKKEGRSNTPALPGLKV